MIKVLLLGGNGYLGKIFKKKYKNKLNLISPSRKELNLILKNNIDNYFKKKKYKNIDIILNLSVYQVTGKYLVKNSRQVLEFNTNLSKNIIYLWRKYLPKSKLISMGASCAYSPYGKGFSYIKGKLHVGTKNFAIGKRLLAKKCFLLREKFKMKYLILVPGTLIGPGEQLNHKKMHFFNGGLYRAAEYKKKIKQQFSIYNE